MTEDCENSSYMANRDPRGSPLLSTSIKNISASPSLLSSKNQLTGSTQKKVISNGRNTGPQHNLPQQPLSSLPLLSTFSPAPVSDSFELTHPVVPEVVANPNPSSSPLLTVPLVQFRAPPPPDAWRIDPNEIQRLPVPPLGTGAYGTVWRGSWHGLPVAVKQLDARIDDPIAYDEFRAEMEVWMRLKYPGIVQLYGAFTEPHLCLVMQFCPNGALSDHLHSEPSLSFSFEQLLRISGQVAGAVKYMHARGVIHRDLKSFNVLIDEEGNSRLSDFGLSIVHRERQAAMSRAASKSCLASSTNSPNMELNTVNQTPTKRPFTLPPHSQLRMRSPQKSPLDPTAPPEPYEHPYVGLPGSTYGPLGTYGYMSPELFTHGAYSEASDAYAFGMFLWELIARAVPFGATPPVQIAKAVVEGLRPPLPSFLPSSFRSLILQCWSPLPKDRPSFGQILTSLKEMEAEVLTELTEPSSSPSHNRWCQAARRNEIESIQPQSIYDAEPSIPLPMHAIEHEQSSRTPLVESPMNSSRFRLSAADLATLTRSERAYYDAQVRLDRGVDDQSHSTYHHRHPSSSHLHQLHPRPHERCGSDLPSILAPSEFDLDEPLPGQMEDDEAYWEAVRQDEHRRARHTQQQENEMRYFQHEMDHKVVSQKHSTKSKTKPSPPVTELVDTKIKRIEVAAAQRKDPPPSRQIDGMDEKEQEIEKVNKHTVLQTHIMQLADHKDGKPLNKKKQRNRKLLAKIAAMLEESEEESDEDETNPSASSSSSKLVESEEEQELEEIKLVDSKNTHQLKPSKPVTVMLQPQQAQSIDSNEPRNHTPILPFAAVGPANLPLSIPISLPISLPTKITSSSSASIRIVTEVMDDLLNQVEIALKTNEIIETSETAANQPTMVVNKIVVVNDTLVDAVSLVETMEEMVEKTVESTIVQKSSCVLSTSSASLTCEPPTSQPTIMTPIKCENLLLSTQPRPSSATSTSTSPTIVAFHAAESTQNSSSISPVSHVSSSNSNNHTSDSDSLMPFISPVNQFRGKLVVASPSTKSPRSTSTPFSMDSPISATPTPMPKPTGQPPAKLSIQPFLLKSFQSIPMSAATNLPTQKPLMQWQEEKQLETKEVARVASICPSTIQNRVAPFNNCVDECKESSPSYPTSASLDLPLDSIASHPPPQLLNDDSYELSSDVQPHCHQPSTMPSTTNSCCTIQ